MIQIFYNFMLSMFVSLLIKTDKFNKEAATSAVANVFKFLSI